MEFRSIVTLLIDPNLQRKSQSQAPSPLFPWEQVWVVFQFKRAVVRQTFFHMSDASYNGGPGKYFTDHRTGGLYIYLLYGLEDHKLFIGLHSILILIFAQLYFL